MVSQAKEPVTIGEAAESGIGIYSAAEAALYARMPPQTLRAWFFDYGHRKRYRQSQIADDTIKHIGFLDFIEALAIRTIRHNYNVSFQKIRAANEYAAKAFGTPYPFAHKYHETFASAGVVYILDKRKPDQLTQITSPQQGQTEFRRVVETWVTQIEFGEDDLANLFVAKESENERIVMNPIRNFGTPIHEKSGYPARVLWEAAIVEGSLEEAAQEYQVSTEAVDLSFRYCSDDLELKFAA